MQAILANRRYTGHQVWNKQRKHEELLDVEDVAFGYETKLKWNEKDKWVWSERPAHPAIIDESTFLAAQQRLSTRGPASGRIGTPRTQHPYALRSLLFHQQCGRRMQGKASSATSSRTGAAMTLVPVRPTAARVCSSAAAPRVLATFPPLRTTSNGVSLLKFQRKPRRSRLTCQIVSDRCLVDASS
ncbi:MULTISPECIES: recombinase family protein [Pseudofrankia]|uniref:recombinase family protein n=1 Tax=Pseudofrankia TaxID=2994363 RepID=UPI000234B1C2